MGRLVFRNDDVNVNTSLIQLGGMYEDIRTRFPEAEIWSVVSSVGRASGKQSVYPDLPLRNHELEYFFDKADALWIPKNRFFNFGKIVSHGLVHCDHAKMSYDAQLMSIVTSCRVLDTNIFVPPFSSSNSDTVRICHQNGIHLSLPSEGWKSLEAEPFDPNHELWFFHSWRFTPESFRNIFKEVAVGTV